MAPSIRSAAAISALSVLVSVSGAPLDGTCSPAAIVTITKTVTASQNGVVTSKPLGTLTLTNSVLPGYSLSPGASLPASIYNPNGPYYNPNDYTPEPFTWPGKPTEAGQKPPPPPSSAPYQYGGPLAAKYNSPCWLPKGSKGLIPALSQSDTNGNSQWGLPECPHLCDYVGQCSSSSGVSSSSAKPTVSSSTSTSTSKQGLTSLSSSSKPASPSSSKSLPPTGVSSSIISTPTGPYNNGTSKACGPVPDTGVTRYYDFHVSYQKIAPDGVEKNGIVVNGGFPGPLIEANWGDWVEIKVTNDLPDEGTSLHWHGLTQVDTPWFDGVPTTSQCPIAPGDSLTYRWRAADFGTSWYHSHFSAQYSGGALGPIVIHGPKTAEYDIDLGPITLADWYHQDYFSLVNDTLAGNIPPSNNNLINGKMNYPCANTTLACTPNAGISKFVFQSGKKHRLRLINTSAEGIQKFTIDGHNFTVIANDFIPIIPYTTSAITLGIGQRTDVIVEANGKPTDSYWMRSNLGTIGNGCSFTDGVSPEAVAAVYYESANTTAVPTTSSGLTTAQLHDCGNDPLSKTQSLCPVALDPNPTTETVEITFGSNGTAFLWFMNNQTFRGNYQYSLLENVKGGNLTFEPEWNVFNFGSNSSVRLILKNAFQFGAHPMHLHGHNFNMLAEGFGTWDGTITNANNTQVRDVQLLRPAQDASTPSYIVMQWKQDNPAVWPLHCHIAWHVSGGLYINVLERPADIAKYDLPDSVGKTCKNWAAWTASNVPDQIDSGL